MPGAGVAGPTRQHTNAGQAARIRVDAQAHPSTDGIAGSGTAATPMMRRFRSPRTRYPALSVTEPKRSRTNHRVGPNVAPSGLKNGKLLRTNRLYNVLRRSGDKPSPQGRRQGPQAPLPRARGEEPWTELDGLVDQKLPPHARGQTRGTRTRRENTWEYGPRGPITEVSPAPAGTTTKRQKGNLDAEGRRRSGRQTPVRPGRRNQEPSGPLLKCP